MEEGRPNKRFLDHSHHHVGWQLLGVLVQELLGLVDFGGQVRAAATIGVVEEHELTVLLAHFVLVQLALTGR